MIDERFDHKYDYSSVEYSTCIFNRVKFQFLDHGIFETSVDEKIIGNL